MENFIKQNLLIIAHTMAFMTIFVLLAFGGTAFAQSKSNDKECKNKQKTSKKKNCKYKKSKAKTPTRTDNIFSRTRVITRRSTNNYNFRNSTKKTITEKSIAVHPKVYITLCVLRGKVRVNGWRRNEARVFLRGRKRSPLGFKVRQREDKKNKPVWVQVVGFNPKERARRNFNTCLSGDIELDIPKNASVKIENSKGESETSIDSVRVATVKVLGGDIYLSNVADRITANTYQGGVTVRNSSGKMSLNTTTGNIVAYNTKSHGFDDYFKAKTRSGAITLQSVEQKEVESSSISGSINYVGRIRSFGKYGFSTNHGSINLAIAASSSCQIVAAYGGSFRSELPLKNISKERTGSLVFLRGTIGNGSANLNLKSFHGTIRIREKKEPMLASF